MPATMPMAIGPDVLRDPGRASRLEWFTGDGRGGYAASTPLGQHTRREHTLLAVAQEGEPRRFSLLARVEETVEAAGARLDLGTNAYPGAVFPRGFEHALRFTLDPLPTLVWEVPGGTIARTIGRLHHRPATVISYRVEGVRSLDLTVRPLLAYRGVHVLQHENAVLRAATARSAGDVVATPYPHCPQFHLRLAGATWTDEPVWYHQFEYARDGEAGREYHEDLWSPGFFRLTLRRDGACFLIAWAGPIAFAADGAALLADARRRLRGLSEGVDGIGATLRRAADAFVVARDAGRVALLTGFPQLGERAAETAAALPGVLVASGRPEEARAALKEAAREVGERAEGEPADAALWAVLAAARYVEATRDAAFAAAHLLDPLGAALDAIRAGRHPRLELRSDALLAVSGRTRLRAETLQGAAPIEVQGLWVNALLALAEVAREAGRGPRGAEWMALAHRTRDAVGRLLWSDALGYLADAAQGPEVDRTLRPYQVLAIALPHALLPRERAVRALQAVRRGLVAPVGLRERPGHDAGGEAPPPEAWTRPALAALYFEALIRVHGEQGKADAWRFVEQLQEALRGPALGSLPEELSAAAPHQARGDVASAFSVGEALRLVTRLGRRPAHRILSRRA